MSHLRRAGIAAAALALTLTPSIAHAGPDQDKDWIVSQQHVDAPIPIWHDDTRSFTLNTINLPMENTALWIPKAWSGNGEKDEAKNQLTIPANRPDLAFLGNPGDVLNAAPQTPGPNNTPIWAGLGSDSSAEFAAAEDFEGGIYTLDLVRVEGPGRMEMFIDNGDGVTRFLSSHDDAYRSVYNPRHSHMYTTFTQPGRYRAYYTVSARDIDGTTMYSAPITPLTWQVGGSNPAEKGIKDIDEAWNSARNVRADGNEATPTLTLAPHAGREHPGDANLSDITLRTASASDKGRMWVSVNGYYLADVPVSGGSATVSEVLGAEDASIQAVYIPEDEASARWASAPTPYSQRDTAPITVTEGAAPAGENNPDPSPTWNPQRIEVTNPAVTVSFDRTAPNSDAFKATIRAADPHLRAAYKVDLFEEKGDFSPACSVEGTLGEGGMDVKNVDLGVCAGAPMYMKTSLRPHPKSDATLTIAERENVQVTSHFGMKTAINLRGSGNSEEIVTGAPLDDENASEPAPNPTPTDGADNGSNVSDGNGADGVETGDPTTPGTSPDDNSGEAGAVLDNAIELHKGHVDIRLRRDGSTFGFALKDDTLEGAATSVLRDPSSVTLRAGKAARYVRTPALEGPAYDVLGAIGEATYVLPETQKSDIIWPGLSTEGIDYASFPNGIDLSLRLTSAPEGARAAFFQGGSLGGQPIIHFDSRDGEGTIHTTSATHMHGNWVFSAPGTYRIEVGANADGDQLAPAATLTFVVVAPTEAEAPAPAPEPDPTPAPVPSEDPAPVPTPQPAPSTAPAPEPMPAPTPTPTLNPSPALTPAPTLNPAPTAPPRTQAQTPRFPVLGAPRNVSNNGAAGTGTNQRVLRPRANASAPLTSAPVTAASSASASSGLAGSTTPNASAQAGEESAQSGANAAQSGMEKAQDTNATAQDMLTLQGPNDGGARGWSPYWLLLLLIPATLGGAAAGYLIRTR